MKKKFRRTSNPADQVNPLGLSAPSNIKAPKCSHKFCKSCLIKYTEMKTSEGFDGKKSSNQLTCNQYGNEFWFQYTPAWDGLSEMEFINDTRFIRWYKSNNVKKCPNCSTVTKNYSGFPCLTCAKCKEKWCYRCECVLSDSYHDGLSCALSKNGFDIVWYCILLMISAPVTIPFWVGFYVLGVILFNDLDVEVKESVYKIIMKYRWICLIISFITSPLVIIGGVCVLFVKFAIQLTPRKLISEPALCIFTLIYVLFMSLFLLVIYAALASIAISLLPVIGIILIPIKIYYQVRHH